MDKKSVVLLMSAYFITTSAMACTSCVMNEGEWTWMGSLSLGAAWQNAGDTQTIELTPTISKTYIATNSYSALFDGEVFVGMQALVSPTLKAQLGLALAATTDATPSGVIWDDALPQFENYTYSYKIQHTHLAAKGKLILDDDYWVAPWVSLSLGIGSNNAYDFTSTPIIYQAVPTPNFASQRTTAFTYTMGIGVQKELNDEWQIGIGYEFADWGKSQLGPAAQQTLNNGLALSHLYTNGILFNLTFVK